MTGRRCVWVVWALAAIGFATMAFLPFARASHVTAPNGYPVPHEKNQIFFVQRSMNPNTIVYTARLNANGLLDPRKPVDVFWRRYNDEGEKQDLSFLERSGAFGVNVKRVTGSKSAFRVSVVSYPERSALLTVANGRPRLEAKVAGEPAELIQAFLHLDESGSVPSVTRVDLIGRSLATGREVRESFVP
jgi:hypothetical protein